MYCALLIALALLAVLWQPQPPPSGPSHTLLRHEVAELRTELQQLRQEQLMPALVLDRHRASICFLYGVYSFHGGDGLPAARRRWRGRVAGSGFLVAPGLVATNRHIAEPWFDDPLAEDFLRGGARPRLEKLVAFFPGISEPVELTAIQVSQEADLAVARFDVAALPRALEPLPLAAEPAQPGAPVIVVGYPMGLTTMLAKSPAPLDRRVNRRHNDLDTATELASLSLIRPSATFGRLGDVVGMKLVYDAPTAQGASGGPVFNARGEVMGINAAYLQGFTGGTLGISVEALLPLLARSQSIPQSGNQP